MRSRLWLSLLLAFVLTGQCRAFGIGGISMGSDSGSGSGSGGGGGSPFSGNSSPPTSTVPIIRRPFGPPQVVQLRPNDVVVFAGDSVTFLGGMPGGWIDTFNRQVQQKNPWQNINVIASGVGGNTAAMLDARMEGTVLNYNPTVVVVFIGINDVRHAPMNPDGSRDLSGYMSTIQDIIQKCRNCSSVRSIVLMTPMAIGDKYDGEGQWDTTIDTMAQDLRTYAASNGIGLIDVRRVVIEAETMYNTEDKEFGVLMDQTLVHPTALGSQILAGTALMGFGQ